MCKRGVFCLLLVALCLLAGCGEVALPTATDRFFVNDFADILSDSDEDTVYQAGVALQEATDAQVVLVTVQDTDGLELEEYSLQLAREWGIGDSEEDNGILLLFTVDGPHSRLEIGYGLEGAIPDSKAGRILDTYLVPGYEDETSWSARLTDTYKAVVNEVYAEYGLTDNMLPLETLPEEEEDDMMELIFMIPFFIILLLALLRGRGGGGLLGFMLGSHFHGGGFHGGFHGGGGFRSGGGGFGGGGGGFGGGGASR